MLLSFIPDDYANAVTYRDRQRRLTPPIYNEARVTEQPIPRIRYDAPIENDAALNAGANAEDQMPAGIANGGNNVPLIDYADDGEDATVQEAEFVAGTENGALEDPNECLLETAIDEPMIDCIQDGAISVKNEDPLLETLNDFGDDGELDVLNGLTGYYCEVLDDDIMLFYDDINAFKPKPSGLQMKTNDIFSGSMPYKEYVGLLNN